MSRPHLFFGLAVTLLVAAGPRSAFAQVESAAVHLIDEFLSGADPPADARIVYGPGEGHCWVGLSALEIMQGMGVAVGASVP